MASLAVLRKAGSSSAIFRKLRIDPLRSASVAPPSLTRSFSVDSQSQVASVDSRKGDAVDIDRRSQRSVAGRQDRPSALFADAFDPFSPTRSLSQVLNLMDQLMEDPFQAVSRGFSGGSRRGWDVKEDDNALSLRIDMPGLAKEDVKVAVEQNTLIIRGEGGREEGEEENERRYSSRIDLPPNLYKIDEIKAEMKNGVLKVVVPKVQEEERRDVYQVPVQ